MDFAPAPFPAELRAGYRAAGHHTDIRLGDLLRRNGFEFGARTAVIEGDRELTWAQLVDASLRFAGFLAAHGIGPGDPVVWQLPNWWEAMVVGHGIWAAGAISVPVVPIYREHELTQNVHAVQPRAVGGPAAFRGSDHVALLAAATAGCDAPPLGVVVRGAAPGWVAFDDALAGAPQASVAVDPDAPVLVGFTSGTTSGAKGAVISTRGLLTVPLRHVRAVP
jgi:acyl-CoA synthetase